MANSYLAKGGGCPASEIVDVVYPIGSIYMSVSNVSPTNLFGGTWEQIKDTFLLSAGDTYSGGSTGGSSTHTHRYGLRVAEYFGDVNLTTSGAGLLAYDSSGNVSGITSLRTQADSANTDVNSSNTSSSKSVLAAHIQYESDTASTSTLPPYLTVYMWKRTA